MRIHGSRQFQASGTGTFGGCSGQPSPQIHGALPNCRFLGPLSANVRIVRGDIAAGEGVDAALDGVEAIAHLAAETGTGQSMYQIARYNAVNTRARRCFWSV